MILEARRTAFSSLNFWPIELSPVRVQQSQKVLASDSTEILARLEQKIEKDVQQLGLISIYGLEKLFYSFTAFRAATLNGNVANGVTSLAD